MPKEYYDCVAALKAEGKSEDEAQKTCAIAYYEKHGKTPQEAEKMDAKKFAEFSFEDKRRMVQDAISWMKSGKVKASNMPESYPWIRDMFDDRVVVEDGGKLFEYPYTLAADGTVTLGDAKPVKMSYEALAELRDVEIVKTGDHVAQDGSKVTYLESDLDQMIVNAAALKDTIKPPIVVSHADGDASAAINAATVGAQQVGWMAPDNLVKKKNADGSVSLFASFKDIAKNAVDKIGTELKRVSAEIYKNYKAGEKEYGKVIRRVSFVPIPAIKNMADVTQAHLVFGEAPDQPTTWVTLSEAAPQSTRKETNTMDVQELAEQVTTLTESVTKMQEENKKKDEEITKLQAANKEHLTKLSETEQRRKRDDISRFCKDRLQNGQMSPAQWSMGVENFMARLEDNEVAKFGEGAKSPELTLLGFMKAYLQSIPKGSIVRFGEIAKVKPTTEQIDDVEAKKKELISKFQESHPKMAYKDVVVAVSTDHPELFARDEE